MRPPVVLVRPGQARPRPLSLPGSQEGRQGAARVPGGPLESPKGGAVISRWAWPPWLVARVEANPGSMLERIGAAFLFLVALVLGIELSK